MERKRSQWSGIGNGATMWRLVLQQSKNAPSMALQSPSSQACTSFLPIRRVEPQSTYADRRSSRIRLSEIRDGITAHAMVETPFSSGRT